MSWRVRLGNKKRPEGWELIEPSLDFFEGKLRDAVNEPHEGKRKAESQWPIHRIHYEKNRYIYELYYKEGKISQELYDFLARHKVIDTALISKWRQKGYEILCSMSAINKNTTTFGTAAICRVPLAQRSGHIAPSALTGCVSCASGDGVNGGPVWWTDPYTLWAAKKRKGGPGSGGKAPAAGTAGGAADDEDALDGEVDDPEVAKRLKALRDEPEDPEVAKRLRALRGEE
eukprot:CAMPEP_0119414806 /NCGR_PEP_ID=MMETSP1335-20130426/7185_1 /TAXON_ID=259385 /ORGANISM="Chrysoculter rhomboideus, Strain RCC1486" /LENGTH=229 /DNA_ID=CAMNT_0007439697 /DNA_START=18 /DNA_END=707 /DNA_ORIENTATION=+